MAEGGVLPKTSFFRRDQKRITYEKPTFYEQVTSVKGLFFIFLHRAFAFVVALEFRCSPPCFYSHSG